jgi:protein involved in polysaccharide export with SLBB domain
LSLFLIVAIQSSGCGGPVVKRSDALVDAEQVAAQRRGEPYRLTPGDELELKFYFTPELDQTMLVSPDGSIELPLVGKVVAAGFTVEEARRNLVERYRGKLREPDIAINVTDYAGQRVFIGGEILNPGAMELDGRMTVLSSINEAGGFSDRARMNEVVLIRRRQEGGQPVIVMLNMMAALEGTDLGQDLHLLPYDIVWVPVSPVGNVNIWVDQYIRRNIPTPYVFTAGSGQ